MLKSDNLKQLHVTSGMTQVRTGRAPNLRLQVIPCARHCIQYEARAEQEIMR